MSTAFRATVGSLEIDKDALRIYDRICLSVLGVNVTVQVEVESYTATPPQTICGYRSRLGLVLRCVLRLLRGRNIKWECAGN